MSVTQTGLTQKGHSTDWIDIHQVHHEPPTHRTVAQVLERASHLEQDLPNRVLPFAEDWDLVILAREIKRLRKMIDIP